MLRPGDMIEYLDDVSSPPNQKGYKGQTKVIDRDIPMWTAKFLLRGGKIRPYDLASPLQIETEKTKESPDDSVDVPSPDSVTSSVPSSTGGKSIKAKKERRTAANGRRKIIS